MADPKFELLNPRSKDYKALKGIHKLEDIKDWEKKTPYECLGVTPESTLQEITRAYHNMCYQYQINEGSEKLKQNYKRVLEILEAARQELVKKF